MKKKNKLIIYHKITKYYIRAKKICIPTPSKVKKKKTVSIIKLNSRFTVSTIINRYNHYGKNSNSINIKISLFTNII